MSMVSFVDGTVATVVVRLSREDTAVYDDVWFDSTFPDGVHEFVIQNSGGPSDSPFQLDRFIVTGSVVPVQGAAVPPASPTASFSVISSPAATTTAQTSEIAATPITTASSLSAVHPSLTFLPVSVTSSSTGASSSISSATGSQTTGQSHFLISYLFTRTNKEANAIGSASESVIISTSIQLSTIITADGNQQTQKSSETKPRVDRWRSRRRHGLLVIPSSSHFLLETMQEANSIAALRARVRL
ncbi:hypothetical protein D9613_012563 [Agrocybe pediades]|uniref:Uncharacterized protein n=1 Tax=Agrocybe pediades TaxID=84607 RepID=A0A8H4VN44_9AGAR|nr:hypothetical protein D9613_012563 [Agrocybe pediades]